MARATPDQAAARWAQRLSGATEAIQAGVRNVTVAPGVLAARQKAAYLQNVTANVDKWASHVAAVDLPTWQQQMLDKGVQRVAQGAQQAQGKFQSFLTEFLPFLDRVTAATKAMPKVTLEDSIARMNAQVRGVAQFKRGGGGRV